MSNPLLMKLRQTTPLSPHAESAIVKAMSRYKVIPAHQEVVWEGHRPSSSRILLDGVMCRYTALPDGKRQILSFLLAGDFCDLSGFVEGWLDHAVGTLAPCTVAAIDHESLTELINEYPPIGDALWRETLRDAAICRAWIASLGRRSAYERLAHLFCEVALRLESVGMKRRTGYDFVVTQVDLGDALGLSVVHVNRMLQQLRFENVITYQGNTFAIHNWARLTQIAGFNPAYLHLGHYASFAVATASRDGV